MNGAAPPALILGGSFSAMEGSSSPPRESRDRAMKGGIEQSFQKRKEKRLIARSVVLDN
jgi:hypothetical protein